MRYVTIASTDISQTAIEYITQSLLKGKKLIPSCKAFVKKFSAIENPMFIGQVDYTAQELATAVLMDKAHQAVKNAQRMKTGMGFMALKGTAQQFGLEESELRSAIHKVTGGENINGILNNDQ